MCPSRAALCQSPFFYSYFNVLERSLSFSFFFKLYALFSFCCVSFRTLLTLTLFPSIPYLKKLHLFIAPIHCVQIPISIFGQLITSLTESPMKKVHNFSLAWGLLQFHPLAATSALQTSSHCGPVWCRPVPEHFFCLLFDSFYSSSWNFALWLAFSYGTKVYSGTTSIVNRNSFSMLM